MSWSLAVILSLSCWLPADAWAGQELDSAGPLRVIPYPILRQWLDQEDPLPWSRTVDRLRAEGIPDAADYTAQQQKAPSRLATMEKYREQTLVILWDKAPGARWALNVESSVHSLIAQENLPLPKNWTHRWERQDDRNCTLIYEADHPSAVLRVTFQARRDHVEYSLALRIDDDVRREGLSAGVCFNHCWAVDFGRDAWALTDTGLLRLSEIPNPQRIWIRQAVFSEAGDYGRQEEKSVVSVGIGANLLNGRMVGDEAVRLKIPVGSAHGRFIATQRSGDRPMTVAHTSPDAISAGWSFWPCTDLHLVFRTVAPRAWTTARARIYFLAGRIEANLDRIQLAPPDSAARK